MENTNLKPAIRFSEFTENWKPNILGKLENVNFLKGKGISKADIVDDGKTECIRYGELYTIYDEVIDKVYSKTNLPTKELVLSNANDVIMPASGETQIDIATASCVLRENIALSGDLNIIRSEINGVFLSYYLNNKKKKSIARLAQGSSVIHLYNPHLKTLKLNLPIPDEQKKIAFFLTSIETRISLLEEKKDSLLDFKKGVLQKIFNQEIRFKDDYGNDFPDWEEKKLGVVGNTINGLTGKTKEDFGSGKPFIQYTQIFNSSKVNTKDFGLVNIGKNDNQTKVQFGDILFTTSSETPHEVGMSSVLLEEIDELYLNSFSFGFRPNNLKELVPSFAQYLFRSNNVRRNIIKLAQGSTRYNMSKLSFMKQTILLPEEDEQIKIANYLSALDDKIEALQQKLDANIDFKKGLLQKMFV